MKKSRVTNKEMKAWELTRLWYCIISETSNAFITMSRQQEDEWERNFTYTNMKKYTERQLDAEIESAKVRLASLNA